MSKNKKITFIISSLSGGGAENVCISMANIFVKNGWEVDLLILKKKNDNSQSLISKKIKLVTLDASHARTSILPLTKYFFKNKPKIVLLFNYEITVIILILRLILNLKLTIISRNTNMFTIRLKELKKENYWSNLVSSNLIKIFYSNSDHVINQCEAMRQDLNSYFPKLINKSSTIYNPISIKIDNFIKKHNLSQIKKQNYLLCIGRLEKQKAFQYAIEAFAKVSNKFPELRLKIVGKGSLENELKKNCIDYGISNKIDFEGFQENIIPYYLYARGTMLTSLYEGYPNVLIESIALNTPVVSFNCPGGPSEIIKDGVNGFIANHLDTDDLSNKIIKLLNTKFNSKDLELSLNKNQINNIYLQYSKLIESKLIF